MLKQFYEKALPSQGVYCVSGLSSGRMANRFAETLDGVLEEIEKLKDKKADVFVALGTFEGYSRKAVCIAQCAHLLCLRTLCLRLHPDQ